MCNIMLLSSKFCQTQFWWNIILWQHWHSVFDNRFISDTTFSQEIPKITLKMLRNKKSIKTWSQQNHPGISMPWIYKYYNYSLIFRFFSPENWTCVHWEGFPWASQGWRGGWGGRRLGSRPAHSSGKRMKEGGGLLLLLGVVGGNWEWRLDGKNFPEVTAGPVFHWHRSTSLLIWV